MKNKYIYSEVLDIIDNMEAKYKEIIPEKLMDFLNENKDLKYQKHVDPRIPLSQQNISKDAITILAMINLKYWVKDEKQKIELLEKYNDNKEMNNNELKKFFELSDNKGTNINESRNIDVNKNLTVKKYDFLERIKKWFHDFRKRYDD